MADSILNIAAKALIVNREGKILIVRESATHDTNTQSGRFGLPGGRLNPGEHFFDGLKREVLEEVGLKIVPIRPLYVGEWYPAIKGVPHQVVGVFVLCKPESDRVSLSEEHDRYEWIDPADHVKYTLMDPEDKVVDEYLKQIR